MDLKAQNKWGWMIAVYLFLAGLGAGAYFTGVVASFMEGEGWSAAAKIGLVLGWPCVFVGAMFLIADLGTPKNFWRAFMKPGTSWVARGTIVISIFMALNALHFLVWIIGGWDATEGARQVIGVLGAVFAFGTMVYTGLLLGANRPIAFWSTALVPVLFLVSALSTGMMAVMLVAIIGGESHEGAIASLARLDIMLIVLEIVIVAAYLQGAHRVPESRASAKLVLNGAVAPLFWFGVALVGLAVPLVFELLGVYGLDGSGASAATVVAAIGGLIGGLILRRVVLAGGIQAPLRAGRFEFALPEMRG